LVFQYLFEIEKKGLYYNQILLGFLIRENGKSRWLKKREISDGTIHAINLNLSQACLTIGVIEPWDRRPNK